MDRTIASPVTPRTSSALYALLVAAMLVATAALEWLAYAYADALIAGGVDFHDHLPLGMGWLLCVSGAATAVHGGAFLVFIRHAQRNDALDRRQVSRWAIAHAVAAPASMPVYWWRYLRV